MLFVASKLLQAITQPLFWLVLWWALALLMLGFRGSSHRWRRAALGMLWAGMVVLAALGFKSIPDSLLRSLEDQYAVPKEQEIKRHVGLIVLGGAIQHPDVFVVRGEVPLGEAAERMSTPVGLLRQHPHLKLVFSGGEGRLLTTGTTEAALAQAFYTAQGVDMARVTMEGGSRTTRENAQQVAHVLGQRCQEPWLLVTSAWHMPRSMAEFEAVGCNVTAYPVDFRTSLSTSLTEYSLAHSLVSWQTALHEWLGLWVYRMTR
jgi:uncharacterized SAM-binding protein YcdF (DUF218 family)